VLIGLFLRLGGGP
jgi:AAA domain